MDARRTRDLRSAQTCRRAMRSIYLFSPNEQRGGGRGRAARLFILLLFPVQQITTGIDLPPYKVVIFGLVTNTLNVRNNNVSVQYNGGLLPDIILSTQCSYHRGTRSNAMKRFCLCRL